MPRTRRKKTANLFMVLILILSVSLGCSYFGNKTESPAEIKPMTAADVKNSSDLVSMLKTQDRVKASVLTKVIGDEPATKADGEIARATAQYKRNWERTDVVDIVVIKFSSPEKAAAYLDGAESSGKAKGETPARGKKPNGDPTLLFADGKTLTFMICKKDFCYNFPLKGNSTSAIIASADFFSDYEKEFITAKN